jgi:hypothetical protein
VERDQNWAISQLRAELRKFVESDSRAPKPEYYIFVTNVDMSSAAGGGKDRANRAVESYYSKLPLKGHAIWDANQLACYFAANEPLRRRFTAYLTPGDVLAACLAEIERRRPNTTKILTSFLERELRADDAARLDQAGNRTDDQLRLARIFFDLPAAGQQHFLPPTEAADPAGRLPPGVLVELLNAGSRVLDPEFVFEQETAASNSQHDPLPTRFVLLGGPGSGKSTVGQVLAQIHRAALLERRPQHLLESQVRQSIIDTRSLSERDRLPWPSTPRYPFRVDLNRFAKALGSEDADRVNSLDSYLLNMLKGRSTLLHEDLIEWLSGYPWLLILDGLDEVPATSNRDAVVKSVSDFLAEARQARADMLVVATSRQQGYGGEFASGVVAFRHILPLSKARALQYVSRYADARFGASDPPRAQDIVATLRRSAANDLTAQLMVSPLQVTFMATVVAASGDPGEDRWQLFQKYYQTIYDRERQKAVPPYDRVLSKQQTIIDRLHHDVGFWLQYEGESASDGSVSLSIDRFQHLVEGYLSEAGKRTAERNELVRQITEAARQRLVFLTSRVDGELSFDVRSLQEYMAAECLMTGPPDVIRNRLVAIAPNAYWRNVILFGIGRCFGDAQSRHLQDFVRSLCEDMNNSSDQVVALTRSGSELALDVLQSGIVRESPNHARHLTRVALQMLAQPESSDEHEGVATTSQRLATVYNEDVANVFEAEVKVRTGQSEISLALGGWALLSRLAAMEIPWARERAEQKWPADTASRMAIFRVATAHFSDNPWLNEKLDDALAGLKVSQFTELLAKCGELMSPRRLLLLSRLFSRSATSIEIPFRFSRSNQGGFFFNLASVDSLGDLLIGTSTHGGDWNDLSLPIPEWLPITSLRDYSVDPSHTTLSLLLRNCASDGWQAAHRPHLARLPWPVAACLFAAESGADLLAMADELERGLFGFVDDWRAAESRWKSAGINSSDFDVPYDRLRPFDAKIAVRGFPVGQWGLTAEIRTHRDQAIRELHTLTQTVSAPQFVQLFAWHLCRASAHTGGLVRCVTPTELRRLVESDTRHYWYENVVGVPKNAEDLPGWIDFYDYIGRLNTLGVYFRAENNDDEWAKVWQAELESRPEKLGLLRLLGRLASVGALPVTSSILSHSFMSDTSLEPRFRLAGLLVRLANQPITDEEARDIAGRAINLIHPPAEPGADRLLFMTIERRLRTDPSMARLVLELHKKMPTAVEGGTANCERLLRELLRTTQSDLQGPNRLAALQLPTIAMLN